MSKSEPRRRYNIIVERFIEKKNKIKAFFKLFCFVFICNGPFSSRVSHVIHILKDRSHIDIVDNVTVSLDNVTAGGFIC